MPIQVIDPSRGQPQDKETVFQYWMKADVYSYSMVLWQLCTREEPFGGDGSKAQLEAIVDPNKMVLEFVLCLFALYYASPPSLPLSFPLPLPPSLPPSLPPGKATAS